METTLAFLLEYGKTGIIIFGAFFMFVAGFGILTLPDVFTRLHANTKSATMGAGCVLLGAAIHFQDTAITVRLILIVVFLFVTAPVAAHMIGRAAYFSSDSKLWEKTLSDALKENADPDTHEVSSPVEANSSPRGRKAQKKT